MQAMKPGADTLPPLPGAKRKFSVQSQYKVVNGRMLGEVGYPCEHVRSFLMLPAQSFYHTATTPAHTTDHLPQSASASSATTPRATRPQEAHCSYHTKQNINQDMFDLLLAMLYTVCDANCCAPPARCLRFNSSHLPAARRERVCQAREIPDHCVEAWNILHLGRTPEA